MSSYEAYKNINNPDIQDFMLRCMLGDYDLLVVAIKNQTAELEELRPRKGVPKELKVMQWKSKPPNNIA